MVSRGLLVFGSSVVLLGCIFLWFELSSDSREVVPAAPSSPSSLARATPAPVRKGAPGPAPQLCVFFVTCNRPRLLEQAVHSVFSHMAEYEPNLKWEAVLIDQRTPEHERASLFERYNFDLRVYATRPRGLAWPFNMGHFAACSAPYVAVIEDDWVLEDQIHRKIWEPRFFEQAIQLLQAPVQWPGGQTAVGVLLRTDDFIFCDHDVARPQWVNASLAAEAFLCTAGPPPGSPYRVYGSVTNGPSVYSREVLKKLGPQQPTKWRKKKDPKKEQFSPEAKWSNLAGKKKLGLLWVQRLKSRGLKQREKRTKQKDIPHRYLGLFKHIGFGHSTLKNKNSKSPCGAYVKG